MNSNFRPALTLIVCGAVSSSCSSSPHKPITGTTTAEPPKLLKPYVNKKWIPPTIRNGGTEWEEGHFIYQIERGTTWSQ
jgi:hypothetical protein